jgi:quinolinate synthase
MLEMAEGTVGKGDLGAVHIEDVPKEELPSGD